MFHVKLLFFLILFIPFFSSAQHFGTTTLEVKSFPVFPTNSIAVESYLSQFLEFKTSSREQKEWFYWTNYSRSNPRKFWDSIIVPIMEIYPSLKSSNANSLRKELYNSPPLPFFKPNSALINTAQQYSEDLSKNHSTPSHTSPTGVTFEDRMKAAEIKICAGENISFGPPNALLMLILLYIDEGVPELGHRKALLNPSYQEMGIGISAYPNNHSIVIQDFACKQKK